MEKVKFHGCKLTMHTANYTQQVCHGTNKLCTQTLGSTRLYLTLPHSTLAWPDSTSLLKSWSTCVWLLSLPKFRPHGLTVLSHDHLYLYSALYIGASSVLYNPFLPRQLPRIYNFILTTLSFAYLVSFTLICCILSECQVETWLSVVEWCRVK